MRANISALLVISAIAPVEARARDAVDTFVRGTLNVTSYERANADLNGDGQLEAVVYVNDQNRCGSGGCNLLILTPEANGYRVVLRTTVTWPPIRLLETTTGGWRDIAVTVRGGGITRPYTARLRFDGQRYPSNPTVPPAVPLISPSGRVLIRG